MGGFPFDRGGERVGVFQGVAQIGEGGVDVAVLCGEGCGISQCGLKLLLCFREVFKGVGEVERLGIGDGFAIKRLRIGKALGIGADVDETITHEAFLSQPCLAVWSDQASLALFDP